MSTIYTAVYACMSVWPRHIVGLLHSKAADSGTLTYFIWRRRLQLILLRRRVIINPRIIRRVRGTPLYFSNAIFFLAVFSETLPCTSWLFISASSGAKILKNVAPLWICIPKSEVPMGIRGDTTTPRSKLLCELETKFQRLPPCFRDQAIR